MELLIWAIIALHIGSPFLACKVLKDKGYGKEKYLLWIVACLFFGLLAFFLCLGMPNLTKQKQQQEMQEFMKKSRSSHSTADELKKIKDLYDSGVINKQEYERKRNELVKKL